MIRGGVLLRFFDPNLPGKWALMILGKRWPGDALLQLRTIVGRRESPACLPSQGLRHQPISVRVREDQRALILVNPEGVGLRKNRLHAAIAAAVEKHCAVLVETRYAGHAGDYCRAHAGEFDKVISVGGDGLLMDVVNGLIGADVAFGVLPGGSACDFVKAAPGYPAPLERLLGSQETMPVDVGKVTFTDGSARYFLEEAGVGLDAASIAYIPDWLRRVHVKRAYDVGALRAILRYRPVDARVWLDGDLVELPRLQLLAVCNAPYFGDGMPIAPDAKIDDGQLHVFAIADASRFEILRNFRMVRSGTHINHPQAIYRSCRRVRIEAAREMPMCIDGDLVCHTPSEWEVLPERLRLIVP